MIGIYSYMYVTKNSEKIYDSEHFVYTMQFFSASNLTNHLLLEITWKVVAIILFQIWGR